MADQREKLSIHHIGGRFGTGGFPVLPAFERDLVRVYYDADRDCIEQIREKHAGSGAEVHVLPYCLGGGEGPGTLNINYDVTSSSLYPLNPEYASFYFFSYNHDFVAGDSLRTMEQREVRIVSLDGLYRAGSLPVALPDFLSLDVQGAELAVLEGARNVLRENVLGVLVETGLHPLYRGQRLFGDVGRFLDEQGFFFVRFLRYHEYSPSRSPVGLRGEGFQVLGDALFLRKTRDVEAQFPEATLRRAALRKLAFISLAYSQFEYALECLRRCPEAGYQGEGQQHPRYEALLRALEKSAGRMPARFPMTFSEKYTFALSKRRFAGKKALSNEKDAEGGAKGIRERLWLRFVYPNVYRIAELYKVLVLRIWAPLAAALLPASPPERTLKRYGMRHLAKVLKRNRVVHILFSPRQPERRHSHPEEGKQAL